VSARQNWRTILFFIELLSNDCAGSFENHSTGGEILSVMRDFVDI
jgi:hypothetical protein